MLPFDIDEYIYVYTLNNGSFKVSSCTNLKSTLDREDGHIFDYYKCSNRMIIESFARITLRLCGHCCGDTSTFKHHDMSAVMGMIKFIIREHRVPKDPIDISTLRFKFVIGESDENEYINFNDLCV